MKFFIVHDSAGRILRTGSCPDNMVAIQAHTGETVIEGQANDATDYVLAGVVTPRPLHPATLVGQEIRNLPIPTDVWVGTEKYVCDDGTAEFDFTNPGTYSVRVESFPYLDKTFEITVP